jgi:hypothetical protein
MHLFRLLVLALMSNRRYQRRGRRVETRDKIVSLYATRRVNANPRDRATTGRYVIDIHHGRKLAVTDSPQGCGQSGSAALPASVIEVVTVARIHDNLPMTSLK